MLLAGITIWIVVVAILALWLPQNAQHEYAHVVAHRHWGAEILSFVPYPTCKPHFTWAHMSYRQPADNPLERTAEGVCASAPQVTNTVILSVLLGVRWWVPEMPVEVASILCAWYIVNYVDGAWNLGTFYKPEPDTKDKHTDGWRLQKAWHLDTWLCRVGAAAWHLWFGFHLFVPPTVLG